MPPTFNSPKQALEQGVCGQYGWSSRYFRDASSGRWCVEVRWGVGDGKRQTFVSDDTSDESIGGGEEGHAAAAAVALEGPRSCEVSPPPPLPTVEHALGSARKHVPHRGVGQLPPGSWDRPWRTCRGAPARASGGIDVEGNLQTPPVLVQVCVQVPETEAEYLCVLELLRSGPDGNLSADLRASSLRDATVARFLRRHRRRRTSVRSAVDVDLARDAQFACLDLESLASDLAGATSVSRGLARIFNLAWPDSAFRATKDNKDTSSVRYFVDVQ